MDKMDAVMAAERMRLKTVSRRLKDWLQQIKYAQQVEQIMSVQILFISSVGAL